MRQDDIERKKDTPSGEIISLAAWREKKRNEANIARITPLIETEFEAMRRGLMIVENVKTARENFDLAYQTVSELLKSDAPNMAVLIKNIHLLTDNAEYIWINADPSQTNDLLKKMSDIEKITYARFPEGLHG